MKPLDNQKRTIHPALIGAVVLGLPILCYALYVYVINSPKVIVSPPNREITPKNGFTFSTKPSPKRLVTAQDRGIEERERRINDYARQGDVYLKAGKMVEAEYQYGEALKLDDKELGAWYGLAIIADKRGDADKAKKAYKLFLSPYKDRYSSRASDPTVMIRYSEICRESGDLLEERWINRIIAKPNGERTARYLSNLWDSTEPPEGNDAALRTRAEVVTGLRFFDGAIGKPEELEKALRHYDVAIAVSPDDPVPYYFKGKALLSLRRIGEAEQAFATGRERYPSDALKKELEKEIGEIERSRKHIVISEEEMNRRRVNDPNAKVSWSHKFPGVLKPGYVYEERGGKWGVYKKSP